jgi:hypothetical protein
MQVGRSHHACPVEQARRLADGGSTGRGAARLGRYSRVDMPLVDLFIVAASIVVFAALILVVRVNRKDEEQAWRDWSEGGDR